jgi:hypothetical protein
MERSTMMGTLVIGHEKKASGGGSFISGNIIAGVTRFG